MISNSTNIEIIHELIEQLGQQGLRGLNDLFSKLFNEMMKAEREHVLQAAPYERTEGRKGYANGFKDKKVQSRFGPLQLQYLKPEISLFTLNAWKKVNDLRGL